MKNKSDKASEVSRRSMMKQSAAFLIGGATGSAVGAQVATVSDEARAAAAGYGG